MAIQKYGDFEDFLELVISAGTSVIWPGNNEVGCMEGVVHAVFNDDEVTDVSRAVVQNGVLQPERIKQ